MVLVILLNYKQEVWPLGSASNDTGTTLGQDGSDWSHDIATVTFDLEGHGACDWCGLSSSIRVPSLKFVGLAIRKIWRTICVSINGPDMTLPFDLGGHGADGWWGSSSSIRVPSFKFVGLAIRKIWRTMCVTINGPGMTLTLKVTAPWVVVLHLYTKFEIRRPCCSKDMAHDVCQH